MNILFGPADSVPRVAAEALLNSLWQSAALVFFVWLLLLLFRRAGAGVKYGVWLAALLAVVCLPFLNAFTSWGAAAAQNVAVPGDGRPETSRSSAAAPNIPQPPGGDSAGANDGADALVVGDDAAAVPAQADGASRYGVSETAREPLPRRESFRIRLGGGRWPQLFLILWALGASAMMLRLVRSFLSLRRVRRESRPLAGHYQRRLSHWTQTCGIRRTVSLRGSPRVSAPLMLGLRKTTILFPEKLADRLAEDEFDQILLHELAHVRRRDDWGNLAQKLLEAVFFFHPVVWWVGRQLGAERECACDQWVVSVTGARRSYASCLTRLFELTRTPGPAFWAPGATPVRGHLARRVVSILQSKRDPPSRLSAVAFFLPCLVLLTTIHLGRLSPLVAVGAAEPSAEHSSPAAPARPEESRPDNAGINRWFVDSLSEAGVSGGVFLSKVLLSKDGGTMTQARPDDSAASDSLILSASRGGVSQTHPWPVTAAAAGSAAPPSVLPVAYVSPAGGPRPEASNDSAPPSGNSAPGLQGPAVSSAAPSSDEDRLPADFFKTVAALGNSGSQREILSALLRRRGLSRENLVQALVVSKTIDSDGEKAEFLVGASAVCTDDQEVLNAFFNAVSSINSAGERRRVLSALLTAKGRGGEVLFRTLKAAAAVDSDGEKVELLVKAASLYAVDGRAHSAFLEAVASVNSSAEQRRALTALLRPSSQSHEAIVQTVRFARRINSDGEKAEFLTRVAQVCPMSDGLLSAYVATASSIGSSAEQARALSAISKRRETGRGPATQTMSLARNNSTED